MSAAFTFEGRIDGKRANVAIWPDRIEWSESSIGKGRDTQVIGMESITSIHTGRAGLAGRKVIVTVDDGLVEIRADGTTCEYVELHVSRLMGKYVK